MTITNAVPKSFLLLTQSLCVSAVLICSYPNYLWSSGELICTGDGFTHTYTNPSGLEVADCQLLNGKCDPVNASVSIINKTQTVLSITHIKPTDAGEWSCAGKRNVDSRCNLTVVKTPTCSITSKQDTNSLVQYQELSLTVDVRDYYCSTAHNISLQTGNVTTLLMKADSVPSVTDNTSSVTLNVTDSHLGKVGLVFRCDSSQWSVECAGVTKFAPKKPECDITSDKDTETLTLHGEVTLTVNVAAYYDIQGSYCSGDTNFTLQTGEVSQLLHVGDQGLSPITLNVTETHLGGVRLVFNCQVQHWNLSCNGVTRLHNKRKPLDQVATSSVLIISASVVGSLVLVVVVAIVIVFVVKRKVNRIKQRSSVQSCSPPYITVGQPTSAAYAAVEVNNSIRLPSGRGRSHKVDVIDAGGYASVADVVTNGEHTCPWPPRDESDELSAPSADRPKKEIGVIVQKIVPEDDQACVNELYASVNKLDIDYTLTRDPNAVIRGDFMNRVVRHRSSSTEGSRHQMSTYLCKADFSVTANNACSGPDNINDGQQLQCQQLRNPGSTCLTPTAEYVYGDDANVALWRLTAGQEEV
ncbi:uncharacterized protein [Haliotis asinina]|uniref:uncharacterized protein n=1 Tax=Haliotis asinina TaxID=109174 RepID=UPI00353213FC